MVEHYVNGQRVYTLAELSEITHVAEPTLRQRAKRASVEAAGWINPRLPVYRPEDVGIENALPAEDQSKTTRDIRHDGELRTAVVEWLEANDVDPADVAVPDDTWPAPVRATAANGKLSYEPARGLGWSEQRRTTITVPLLVEPGGIVRDWLTPACPTCGR